MVAHCCACLEWTDYHSPRQAPFLDIQASNGCSNLVLSAPLNENCFYQDRCFPCIQRNAPRSNFKQIGDSLQLAFRRGANLENPNLESYISDLQMVMSCSSHNKSLIQQETISAMISGDVFATSNCVFLNDLKQIARWVPWKTSWCEVQNQQKVVEVVRYRKEKFEFLHDQPMDELQRMFFRTNIN